MAGPSDRGADRSAEGRHNSRMRTASDDLAKEAQALAAAAMCAVATPVLLGQAKTAQRLMLAATGAAPKPVQRAENAMIGGESDAVEGRDYAGACGGRSRMQRVTTGDRSQAFTFDVSTVKPADPNARSSNLNLGNDDIRSSNLPVVFLLQFAYGLNGGSKEQIVEAPAWISTVRFDIDAKMDESTAAAISRMTADERMTTLRGMVRTLLANRFHLAVHDETRTLPVLALTAAKGGPETRLLSCSDAERRMDGLHNSSRPDAGGQGCHGECVGERLSRESEIDGQMVVDQTGLNGKYNLTLMGSRIRARRHKMADRPVHRAARRAWPG